MGNLHTALVVAVGANMREEHQSGLVERAVRRSAQFGLECDADKSAPMVFYGDKALLFPHVDLRNPQYPMEPGIGGTIAGDGANLLAGLYGALSTVGPDDHLLMMAITDCHGISEEGVSRVHDLMAVTAQAFLLVVHTSLNAKGIATAKMFSSNGMIPADPNMATVFYTNANGDNVGENLTAHARPLVARWRANRA